MFKKKSRFYTVSFLLMFSFMLSACGTIQGVGKDIQSAGKALENAIE